MRVPFPGFGGVLLSVSHHLKLAKTWLEPEEHRRLVADARRADRSLTAQLRVVVREHLAKSGPEERAA